MRKEAERRFGMERMIQGVEALYEEFLAQQMSRERIHIAMHAASGKGIGRDVRDLRSRRGR